MSANKKKQQPEKTDNGALYVVATPIGNLEDISMRALRILGEVDLIACEDTRHSRKLLSHFDIHTRLISYYKDREKSRAEKIISALKKGKNVALISDAGTPGISDPGSILIQKARQLGISIIPIPGPSALTAALSVAGLPEQHFVFLGFPPARKNQRQSLLKSICHDRNNLVFYESPHRLLSFLRDCLDILGNRQSLWARELTKLHEELQDGLLSELLVRAAEGKIRGESVIIIAGADEAEPMDANDLQKALAWYKSKGNISLKDAVRKITADLKIPRSTVYSAALKIWSKDD